MHYLKHRRNTVLIAAISFALIFAGCARSLAFKPERGTATREGAPAIRWVEYYEAMNTFNEMDQPLILLYFTHDPCEPCRMLEKRVFTDARVVKAAEGLVPVIIRGNIDVQMVQRFKVQTYPMIVFARMDSGEIDRKAGYRDAEFLLQWIEDVAADRNTTAQVRKELEAQPDNVNLLLRQAHNYLDADELEQGRKLAQKALEIEPANAGALVIQSLYHLRLGELDQAQTAAAAALQSEPHHDEAGRLNIMILLKKAEMAQKAENYVEAIEIYSRILNIEPNNFGACVGLGQTHREAGRVDLAREQFQKAAAIRPDSAVPHVALGDLFQKNEDDTAAEQEYLKAIDMDPGYQPPYFRLMELYERNGRREALLGMFEKVFAIEPAGAQNEIAWLLATSRYPEIFDPVAAEQYADAAVALEPSPMYIDTLAEAYYAQGNYTLAIAIIKEAIAIDDADPEYYQGQLEKFQKALEQSLAPEDAQRG